MKKLIVAAVMSCATMSAMASDFYVSGSVGQSDIKGVEAELADHKDTAVSLAAGWQFHENVAVEVGYANTGKFDGAKTQALQTSLVGSYQVMPKVELFGKVGVARTQMKVDGEKYNKTSAVYGVGVGYEVAKNIKATTEFTQYSKFAGPDDKLNIVSVGLKYQF